MWPCSPFSKVQLGPLTTSNPALPDPPKPAVLPDWGSDTPDTETRWPQHMVLIFVWSHHTGYQQSVLKKTSSHAWEGPADWIVKARGEAMASFLLLQQESWSLLEAHCLYSWRNMAVTLHGSAKQQPRQCRMEVTVFHHCWIYAQCSTTKALFKLRAVESADAVVWIF